MAFAVADHDSGPQQIEGAAIVDRRMHTGAGCGRSDDVEPARDYWAASGSK